MKTKIIGIVIFTSIFTAVIIYGALLFLYPLSERFLNISSTAQIGDSFGVLNTLFSGLAFAGVIVTILLQKEELKLQREELAKSSEAQQRSARLMALSELLSDYKYSIKESDDSLEKFDEVRSGDRKSMGSTKVLLVDRKNLNEKRSKIVAELESILDENIKS